MKAINILWDTDGDLDVLSELPETMDIPNELTDEDEIFDYLSDTTGFCHKGFELID